MNKQFPIFNGPSRATGDNKQWFKIKNQDDPAKPVEILIYDQIGKDWWDDSGVGAKDFAESLKAIPADKQILVCINSPGGNVWDGLAIYHQLEARKNRVTTRIDGIAASTASVIALAGKEVQMPAGALFMIHDPWTICVGNAADMQKAIDGLKAHKDALVAIYEKKSGKTSAEIAEKMSAETWFTGTEAKDFGFIDTVTEEEAAKNNFDLSGFRRVPQGLGKQSPTNGAKNTPTPKIMDKARIIALLKKHGATVDDNATIEQLEAQLEAVLASKKTETKNDATPQNVIDLEKQVKALQVERDNERKARIEREIDNAVSERRIVAAQRDSWITRAMKDETILDDIKAMPQMLPGADSVSVECKSEAIADIAKHAKQLKGTVKAQFLRKHENRFSQVWNEGTNTIDANLKQDVLVDQALIAFARILFDLSTFCTRFENIPLRGTNKLQVPFLDLQTAASTAWVAANGYVGGDTSNDNRELEINKRYYQAIRITADELRRQPYLLLKDQIVINGQKLAYDVWLDILSAITVANFPTAAYSNDVSGFDSDDGIDLETAATVAEWPEAGRSLFLNTAFDNQLKKDNAVKLALNIGGTEVLRTGKLPNLFGFSYGRNSKIPANGESLAGWIAFKSALLVGIAPIQPTEEEIAAGLKYQVFTDPDTGISMEMKSFGQPQMNRAFHIIECNYGYAKGNASALQRIVSVAA